MIPRDSGVSRKRGWWIFRVLSKRDRRSGVVADLISANDGLCSSLCFIRLSTEWWRFVTAFRVIRHSQMWDWVSIAVLHRGQVELVVGLKCLLTLSSDGNLAVMVLIRNDCSLVDLASSRLEVSIPLYVSWIVLDKFIDVYVVGYSLVSLLKNSRHCFDIVSLWFFWTIVAGYCSSKEFW